MSYQSVEEAYARCNKDGIEFWKAIQLEDMDENGITEEDSWKRMNGMWQAMLTGIDAYEPDEVSGSGLVGKEGGLMETYQKKGDTLCGDYMAKVMTNALKMGCNNACMKRIVAAPTAGACGVLPAVLVTYYREYGIPEEKMQTGLILRAHPEDARQRSVRDPAWQLRPFAISKAEPWSSWDMPVLWR